MTTVSQLKQSIKGKLRGSTLGKLNDPDAIFREAAANVILRVDPIFTIRKERISDAIYDQVYNYSAPPDIKGGNSVIDIRPIGLRSRADEMEGTHLQQFDIKKKFNTYTIEVINTVKTLRLSKRLDPKTLLQPIDSLTLNGAITLSNDASNGVIDTLDFISGRGSLKFDLSGATGVGTIRFDLNDKIDLEKLLDVGALFDWIKFPNASRLTSVDLKWGSSDTVFWNETATAAINGAFEDNAWQNLIHEWVDASETGSPVAADAKAIDYLEVTFNYTVGAAISNVKLDNITASLGRVYEVVYYSDRLFQTVLGARVTEPSADSDTILLDTEAVNLLLYEFMRLASSEMKGKDARRDEVFYDNLLEGNSRKPGMYDRYADKYPSQTINQQTSYYNFSDLDTFGFLDEDDLFDPNTQR